MECQHCGAKRPNLHAFKETCQDEGRFLVVRCLLCGWRTVEPDTSSYRFLGWSSPWPRREQEVYDYQWLMYQPARS